MFCCSDNLLCTVEQQGRCISVLCELPRNSVLRDIPVVLQFRLLLENMAGGEEGGWWRAACMVANEAV